MKNENIPADVKSKSLKEARDEINDILNKLESKDADLPSSIDDYKRLIQLNHHPYKEDHHELKNMNEYILRQHKYLSIFFDLR